MLTHQFYVYGFYRDIACTNIFYVGKGKEKRENHWTRQRSRNLYLRHIVALVKAEHGFVPTRRLYDNLTNKEACALEEELITKIGRYPDGPLVNMTKGGEGHKRNHSPETRQRISSSKRGHKHSDESKQNMKAGWVGYFTDNNPQAQALLANRSAVAKARWAKPEELEAQRIRSKERWAKPEELEAQRQRQKEYWAKPENRERQRLLIQKHWEGVTELEKASLMQAVWQKRRARKAALGITTSYAAIARQNNIDPKAFRRLIRKGLSIEQAIAAAKSLKETENAL